VTDPASPGPELIVVVTVEDGAATVAVTGEVDVYTAPILRERLYGVITGGASHVVLDLQGMTFIDSTGLGVIVGTLKRLRQDGGELMLRSPGRSTRKVLELTGLANIVDIIDA